MHETIGHREPGHQVMLLLLLVVLVFTVPLRLVVPVPGPEFRRAMVCAMELVFVLPYVLSLARRENFVVLSPVGGTLFIAWLAASVISIAFAAHVLPAVARQAEWVCHILFAASVWHFLRQNRWTARWAIVFAIAGVLVTVLVVFRAWHSDPSNAALNWRQYLPLFTHIRHFGYYTLAGLLLAQLWGADEQVGPARLLAAVPVLCVLWGALIWTGGRAAFVSGLVGLVVVVALAIGRRWIVVGTNAVALSVGSVIAVFMSAGRPELGWHGILSRMGAADLGQFASGRLKFWALASDSFLAHPLFGLGPDAYRYLEPKVFGSHPHNVVLQFLTDYGVVGTVLFGIFFLSIAVAVLRRAGDKRIDLRAERIAAFAVLTAFSANALLDGTFYHATPLMIIGFVVAIGLLPESYGAANGTGRLIAARTGLVGGVATATAGFVVVYIVLLSAFVSGPVPSPDSLRAQLVRHLPFATHRLTLETWIRAWSTEDLAVATDWAHWAHEHSPDAYRFRSLEAHLLAEQGLYQAARSHAREALESATGRMRVAMAESLRPIIDAADANSGQLHFQVDEE